MPADMIKNTSAVSGAKKAVKGEINVSDTLRLSDNMSSIKDILFTDESVLVKSSQAYMGTFTVRGEVNVHILYMGENEEPAYMNSVIPFEYIGECASENDSALYITSKIKSCEIMPMKQRRIDVNVSVVIEGVSVDQIQVDTLKDIEGINNVMMQKKEMSASLIRTLTSSQNFNFSFDAGAVSPGKIIYGSGNLTNVSSTSSHAGILVNGMMKVGVIYSVEDEEGNLSYRSFTDLFPVNHFIETDSSLEYDNYQISAVASCGDFQFIYSDNGLSVEIESALSCNILMFKQVKWESVSDMYSPNVMLKMIPVEKKCILAEDITSETVSFSDSIRIPASPNIFKIAASKERLQLKYEMEQDTFKAYGDIICSIAVLKNDKGAIDTYEIKIPVEWGIANCNFTEEDILVSAEVEECTYDVRNDSVSVNASIRMSGVVLNEITVDDISDVIISDYDQEEDNYISIKVHYFQPGEKLWDLAKTNRTTIKHILSTNAIDKEEDVKAYQPLIIK